jgi:hypothetical protein
MINKKLARNKDLLARYKRLSSNYLFIETSAIIIITAAEEVIPLLKGVGINCEYDQDSSYGGQVFRFILSIDDVKSEYRCSKVVLSTSDEIRQSLMSGSRFSLLYLDGIWRDV